MSLLSNNEQLSAFITHDTTRDIGPHGNEGSLDGNRNISRLNVYNMNTGGRKTKTRKMRMNGGGFGFGQELELLGHGHHAGVTQTMACEQHPKHYEIPSWSELAGQPQRGGSSQMMGGSSHMMGGSSQMMGGSSHKMGGSPAAASESYVLVDQSTVKYPMEGVASENGVQFYGFNGGKNLVDFAGSYAPVTPGVHMGGGPRFLSLWRRVCPGAVAIYEAELKDDMKNPKVVSFIKHYSKVFRTEEEALKCKQASKVKRMLVTMKNALSRARNCLVSLKSKMLGTHKMIARMHLGRVVKHLASLKQTKKRGEKLDSRRKTMRGGYNQYGSNTVQASGYSAVLGSPSAEASPHHVQPHAGNAVDNYNHFTGKGLASPILDNDVSVAEPLEAPVGASLV
uniref:Uncharacterized protein n=1 Tax=viral metagenome TaxID=1070528 RepID=A0A6C0BUA2_9ZZZZ